MGRTQKCYVQREKQTQKGHILPIHMHLKFWMEQTRVMDNVEIRLINVRVDW